jgi:pSer/pThr/pTyr-binding forkhead associated (FHA) protein
MPAYLADFEAEYRRLGPQSFVRAYPWPVLVVAGIGGVLQGNLSRGGTMIASNSELLQATALAGRVFPVVKGRNSLPGPVTIGRTSDNDLAIPEYTISTRHCLLALVDGEYRLTDLGATNGTFVDDVPLPPRKPCRLRGGETLRMGRFTLLFHLPRGFGEFLRQRAQPQDQDQDQDDFGNANKKVI